jgi:hypothetical protein
VPQGCPEGPEEGEGDGAVPLSRKPCALTVVMLKGLTATSMSMIDTQANFGHGAAHRKGCIMEIDGPKVPLLLPTPAS